MAYCSKCGSMLGEGAAFCSICGAAAAPSEPVQTQVEPAAAPPVYQPQVPHYTAQQTYPPKPGVIPVTDEQADIRENKVYAILSYFGPLVLVPIFAAPKSKFARFHANQGLLLCCLYVAEIIVTVLLNLIRVTRIRYIWGIPYEYRGAPWFVTLICTLLWLGVVALAVFGVIYAASGKYKKLPLIGELFTFLK